MKKSRAEGAQDRRDAILDAATAEFVANGYGAARIEDIAHRAGVAKGTVYLNFADKQALFEGVVKARMLPIAAQIEASLSQERASVRESIEAFLHTALALLSDPRAGDMVRLVISESIRFPALTGFYRREVIAPLAAHCGRLLRKAAEAGELTTPATADYPHLIVAPLIVAVVAQDALEEVGVDDIWEMLRVHLDGLFGGRGLRP